MERNNVENEYHLFSLKVFPRGIVLLRRHVDFLFVWLVGSVGHSSSRANFSQFLM